MMETNKPSGKEKGVPLRTLKSILESRLSEVVGSTGYQGRRKTLRDMDNAILREARKRK
jgi:hypothetical protein